MAEMREDLTPWVHPRAQQWLESLFEKSDLIEAFERWLDPAAEPLAPGQLRLLTSLMIILGRPGVWPDSQRSRYERLAQTLHERTREWRETRRSALSIEAHQRQQWIDQQWELETEWMRRRAKLSKRTNALGFPTSWVRFWN